MKFYLVRNDHEGPIACRTDRKQAIADADNFGPGSAVDLIECKVCANTIRMLLAQHGGYATQFKTIYEVPTP